MLSSVHGRTVLHHHGGSTVAAPEELHSLSVSSSRWWERDGPSPAVATSERHAAPLRRRRDQWPSPRGEATRTAPRASHRGCGCIDWWCWWGDLLWHRCSGWKSWIAGAIHLLPWRHQKRTVCQLLNETCLDLQVLWSNKRVLLGSVDELTPD